MIDRLFFDNTSNDTMNDSSNVGAWIRAADGKLIDAFVLNNKNLLGVAAHLVDGSGNQLGISSNPLKVDIVSPLPIDVELSHTNDSVRLGDGTQFLTSTTIGSDVGLDVFVINDSPIPVSINTSSSNISNGYVAVGNTTAVSIGTASATRQKLLVYNNGNRVIFIGNNTVSTTNGFPLSPKSYIELETKTDVYAIASDGTQNIRYVELA